MQSYRPGIALSYSPQKRFKRLSIKFLRIKPLPHTWPLVQYGAQPDMVFLFWWHVNYLSCVPTLYRGCLRVGKMAGWLSSVSPTNQAEGRKTIDPSAFKTLWARPCFRCWRVASSLWSRCMPPTAHSMLTCRDAPRKERCSGSSTSADSFEISRTALAGPYMTKDISQRSRTPSPGAWFCPWT